MLSEELNPTPNHNPNPNPNPNPRQVTMLSEELKLASPDLDAIERWRAKEAECTRRVAELDGVRGERETVRCDPALILNL